eukprot:scaffold76151_cov18-Tisochrysis_lutea.AAC.2
MFSQDSRRLMPIPIPEGRNCIMQEMAIVNPHGVQKFDPNSWTQILPHPAIPASTLLRCHACVLASA